MARFQNSTFRNETIELDGKEFDGCDIQHCILVYRGGKVPLVANSTVGHCQFKFEDSAQNTIDFLHLFNLSIP